MKFGSRDIIGCGYFPDSGRLLFTLNGQWTGPALVQRMKRRRAGEYLYALVGSSTKVDLSVNAGQSPFRWNVALQAQTLTYVLNTTKQSMGLNFHHLVIENMFCDNSHDSLALLFRYSQPKYQKDWIYRALKRRIGGYLHSEQDVSKWEFVIRQIGEPAEQALHLESETLLRMAASCGDWHLVTFLLDQGSESSASNWDAALLAISSLAEGSVGARGSLNNENGIPSSTASPSSSSNVSLSSLSIGILQRLLPQTWIISDIAKFIKRVLRREIELWMNDTSRRRRQRLDRLLDYLGEDAKRAIDTFAGDDLIGFIQCGYHRGVEMYFSNCFRHISSSSFSPSDLFEASLDQGCPRIAELLLKYSGLDLSSSFTKSPTTAPSFLTLKKLCLSNGVTRDGRVDLPSDTHVVFKGRPSVCHSRLPFSLWRLGKGSRLESNDSDNGPFYFEIDLIEFDQDEAAAAAAASDVRVYLGIIDSDTHAHNVMVGRAALSCGYCR